MTDGARPLLRDGGTIAIVAPSGHVPEDGLTTATAYLSGRGYNVVSRTTPGRRDRFMAAPDAQRATDLMEAFCDTSIDAIFAARGGYGSGRLLDRLDYTQIAVTPKPLVAFSDGTALQLALLARAGLVSYTGTSIFPELKDGAPDSLIAETLWPLLRGDGVTVPCSQVRRDGVAAGPLIGGCLSLVVSLLGTGYLPDMTGAILLLEDVNEPPFRIDRMLTQLRHAGVFADVAGVVFGQFRGCESKDPGDGTLDDVIEEVATWTDSPVVSRLPYGHVTPRCVLPIGEQVSLDTGDPQAALRVRAVDGE